MGEIEAAIGIEQLKKLAKIVKYRQKLAHELINQLKSLPGLELPIIKKNYTHSFYVIPFNLDLKKIKFNRETVLKILNKAGVVGLRAGYQNLHLLPMFRNKIAYGREGFPWKNFNNKISYKTGDCKIAEALHKKSFFYLSLCAYDFNLMHMRKFAKIINEKWKIIKK